MPFSKGQKIFALIFIVSFIIMLILAYRSDAKNIRLHYKNVWIVLISIALILGALVFLVKMTH